MLDPRNILTGREIPSEGYCDQPYIVKTEDGTWLCVMTTGLGNEGEPGQHIISVRSNDYGHSWSSPVDIEPADGPEASWALPFITPYGRVYVFYTYNHQNLREVAADDPPFRGGKTRRVDTLGEYAFKYSDDGGRTWSRERHTIPVREMRIDRENPTGGSAWFFWGVGKPVSDGERMFLGFAKVGRFGEGFMAESESCFLRCDNILQERNPDRLVWETLPEGDSGLISPAGPLSEEANLVVLSDGSLFCTWRTVAGHPGQAYSRDGGRTWTPPAFMRYRPDGPLVHHPRAANPLRKLEEGPNAGRYIYWFHNNSTPGCSPAAGLATRNPAWIMGGEESDGPDGKEIHWGRPEVVLFADDPQTGISYPDFVEEGEDLYITTTEKKTARVHKVPDWLLGRIWENLNER